MGEPSMKKTTHNTPGSLGGDFTDASAAAAAPRPRKMSSGCDARTGVLGAEAPGLNRLEWSTEPAAELGTVQAIEAGG